MFFKFLTYPEIYLGIETIAQVRQLGTQENQEFVFFMGMRDGLKKIWFNEYLPSY